MIMENLDSVFKWIKTATKQQRHSDAIEAFAKDNYTIFMQFHQKTEGIVNNPEGSEEYNKAKEELSTFINNNKDTFQPLLEAIKAQIN